MCDAENVVFEMRLEEKGIHWDPLRDVKFVDFLELVDEGATAYNNSETLMFCFVCGKYQLTSTLMYCTRVHNRFTCFRCEFCKETFRSYTKFNEHKNKSVCSASNVGMRQMAYTNAQENSLTGETMVILK